MKIVKLLGSLSIVFLLSVSVVITVSAAEDSSEEDANQEVIAEDSSEEDTNQEVIAEDSLEEANQESTVEDSSEGEETPEVIVEDTLEKDENREVIEVDFEDTKDLDWAKENIARMKIKGIFQGYDDGTFRPNAPVTRLQAIITAVRLLDLEEEAKKEYPDTKLQFKDGEYFEKHTWAKGYVIVALKNGLFDSIEDKVQPNKPATRLWISSLLVRALGLEEDALMAMTDIPDFKDADKIPAGAIGYVNLANEYGIFNGTDEGLFKPHSNITRAQMAAVLDRTYGEMLEENGASSITGVVTEISFTRDDNTGSVSVETFNSGVFTYQISPELLVKFQKRFMTADQILVGDNIQLYVENEEVLEAVIFAEKPGHEGKVGIQEVKVELEFINDKSFELKYENKHGKVKQEIEIKTEDRKVKLKGEKASTTIDEYLLKWDITPNMTKTEVKERVLSLFEEREKLEKLEIEVKFSNGTKIELEFEADEIDEHEDDEEDEDHKEDNENEEEEHEEDQD